MTIDEGIKEKAFAMFVNGATVNQVAKALCNRNWAQAKRLREAFDEANGMEPAPGGPPPKKPRKRAGDAEPAAEEEEPEAWSLELKSDVPRERLDKIFKDFSPAEKARAIATVLQDRVDAMLGAK